MRPSTKRPMRRLKAIHESGHAAIAVAVGVGVECVTIVPYHIASGCCHLKTAARTAEERAMIAIAGDVAAEMHSPGGARLLRYCQWSGRGEIDRYLSQAKVVYAELGMTADPEQDLLITCSDAGQLSVAVAEISEAARTVAPEAIMMTVAGELQRRWHGVGLLAAELLAFGIVDGARAERLLAVTA